MPNFIFNYTLTAEVWIDEDVLADGETAEEVAREYAGGSLEEFCHSFHRNREDWVDDASASYEEVGVKEEA